MTNEMIEPLRNEDYVPTRAEKLTALAELELWVQNLRSGEYEQGKGKLRTRSNKYCCAGVLTEQFIDSRENFLRVELPDGDNCYSYLYQDDNNLLNPVFVAAIPDLIVIFFANRGVYIDWSTLYEMNDGGSGKYEDGRSFSEIADFIEKEYIRPLRLELGI